MTESPLMLRTDPLYVQVRQRFTVTGVVQGVGFRPFVHRIASELGLAGFVGNDLGAVFVEAHGGGSDIDVFAATAKYAVMSGDSAAGTLVEIKIRQLERGAKKLSEEEKKQLYESVKQTYDEQTDPRYGAARLWIDRIIDPMETRDAITTALEAGALNPDVAEFKVGVLQT